MANEAAGAASPKDTTKPASEPAAQQAVKSEEKGDQAAGASKNNTAEMMVVGGEGEPAGADKAAEVVTAAEKQKQQL